MAIRQLSVFLENRVGRLATIAEYLGDAGVNIGALSVADTRDFGILRLLVDDIVKAEQILKAHDVVCHINEVTAIEVDNRPGGLAKLLKALNAAGVNVEYMYAVAEPKSQRPVMVFRFSEAKTAWEALEKTGMKMLKEEDLF